MLYNNSTGAVVARDVVVADTFIHRLRGLMGRKYLPPGKALVLRPCKQVHTFFMRFPIDVVFLDRYGTVLDVLVMPPGRVSPYVRQAQMVVEMPAGTAEDTGTIKNHILNLIQREGRV